MVHVFNITEDDNTVSCDYTPENSDKSGHIVIDSKTEELKDVIFSEYEYGKKMYVSQVRSKLAEMIKQNKPLPKETTIIWY